MDKATILSIIVIIMAILVIISFILNLSVKERLNLLPKTALYIVAKVEEEWGSNMGKVKFAEAYSYIKSKHPFITMFVKEETLTEIIEQALARLKEILASKASKESKEE